MSGGTGGVGSLAKLPTTSAFAEIVVAAVEATTTSCRKRLRFINVSKLTKHHGYRTASGSDQPWVRSRPDCLASALEHAQAVGTTAYPGRSLPRFCNGS